MDFLTKLRNFLNNKPAQLTPVKPVASDIANFGQGLIKQVSPELNLIGKGFNTAGNVARAGLDYLTTPRPVSQTLKDIESLRKIPLTLGKEIVQATGRVAGAAGLEAGFDPMGRKVIQPSEYNPFQKLVFGNSPVEAFGEQFKRVKKEGIEAGIPADRAALYAAAGVPIMAALDVSPAGPGKLKGVKNLKVKPKVANAGLYDTGKYPEIPGFPSHFDTSKVIPIKSNGKIVGGVDAVKDRLNPQRMIVNKVMIAPEEQGKGLGTGAINQLWKDNPDITQITGHSTAEAKSFWLKQGAKFSDRNTSFILERPRVAQPTLSDVGKGFSPLTATPEQQIALVKNAKPGKGKFQVGEIYQQEVAGGIKRPILISKTNPDGSVEGFYVGSTGSPLEKSFTIDPHTLQSAKWNNPKTELQVPHTSPTIGGVKELKVVEKKIIEGETKVGKKDLSALRTKGPGQFTNVRTIDNPLAAPGPLPWETPEYLETLKKQDFGVGKKLTGKDLQKLKDKYEDIPQYSQADIQRLGGGAVFNAVEKKQTFDKLFAKWIAQRDVAETTATQTGRKFKDIPLKEGKDVIKSIETPEDATSVGLKYARPIRETYDKLYNDATKNGIEMGYRENYITHYWNKEMQEVARDYQVFKQKAGFQNERVLPTYEEGIKMGLAPRYEHPGQIIGQYSRDLEKLKANLDFIKELKKEGIIVDASVGSKTPGFVPIRGYGFPQSISRGTEGKIIQGNFYAPQEVAEQINRIFMPEDTGKLGKTVAMTGWASSKLQDITLSGGIPFTPLNAFTIANFTKEILAGRVVSPVASFFRAISGKSSIKFFEDNAEQIKKMQARNIPIRSNYTLDNVIDGAKVNRDLGEKAGNVWSMAINNPTFQRFMPMLQINLFNDIERGLLKAGKLPEEAADTAALAVRRFYGVVDSATEAKRTNIAKNITKTAFFAPKFRESMFNFWINNIKALGKPWAVENRQNVKFMAGALLTYGAMNYLNNELNGRNIWENPKGTEDKLLIPLEDGTTIGIPFLSSIATIPRALYREGKMLLEGDVQGAAKDAFQSYASMLTKPVADVLSNSDYFGREIVNDNDPTGERFKKIGIYLATQYAGHPYIKELFDQRNQGDPFYQRASRGMELPIRYYATDSLDRRYYFANKDEVLKSLTDQDKALYEKLHSAKELDEDGLPIYNKRSEMANALDRLANPQTMRAEAQIAIQTAQQTNEPINPLYLLDPKQQETVLILKTFYPGDKTKGEMVNANISWLKPYWQERDKFIAHLKEKGVIKEGTDSQFAPLKVSSELRTKLDSYFALPSGTGQRSAFLRQNSDVMEYFQKNRELTNAQRADLGLPLLADFSSGFGKKKLSLNLFRKGVKQFRPTALKAKKVSVKGVTKVKIPKSKKPKLREFVYKGKPFSLKKASKI